MVRERMNDENANCAHDGEEYAQLSLLQLPVEMFLHICSFLDASTLHGLSLVCKQFYLILKDADSLWKARIDHIWPNATHSLLRSAKPDKLFWMSSCVAIEKQIALWKQQDSMVKLRKINPQSIRPVLLMHDATACVGATRKILFYSKLPSREECSDEIRDIRGIDSGHYDNICDLTAIDNTIYSCCGDSVKSWMLTNTGLVHQRTYDDIRMLYSWTCVSSCPERGLFAIGSNYEIYVFDSREINKPINQYRPNNTTMTALIAMNTEYILSASYDGMVSVWDQRAGRIMNSITIPGERAYPICVSMRRDNWVCVGDSKAKLHMLDPKNDFELVKSYSTEHTNGITGVRLMHGCLITSSLDGTVRISSLTDPPRPIATL
ncbi:F-box/WD repeat-containing protein 9-like, partial [Temnothorax curvispinosus]|uniref:F-box/WD repeat-containing protein 9-like n=1 Tax=Temnothorax curvispinosus TaxID=300111 RepID=A0A6J1QUY0_9HYME